MLHQCYIADWERKGFEAFGLKLMPFTLGHARLLFLSESPLVVPGSEAAKLDEILFAASVCSMSVLPDRDHLGDIARNIPGATGNVEDQIATFRDYLKYHLTPIPRFTESSEIRAPWPWMLVCRLMKEFRYTEDEAWREIVPKALWLSACSAISEGDRAYGTVEEQALVELMNNG